jgi:outer membrane protein TolC
LAQSFAPGTGFYTVAAAVTAPIFDGFTLYNKQKAAEAALEQAEALYRSAVITAFQNVADALRALQADARREGGGARSKPPKPALMWSNRSSGQAKLISLRCSMHSRRI